VIVGLGQDWLGYAMTPEQYGKSAYRYERLLSPGRETGGRVMDVQGLISDNEMQVYFQGMDIAGTDRETRKPVRQVHIVGSAGKTGIPL
jgi:hypothetical protein